METKESRIFRLAEIITRSLREELPAPERAMLEVTTPLLLKGFVGSWFWKHRLS